jgi:CBS domain containing-hemolysin-like protein
MDWIGLIAILISLFFIGLLNGLETAFVSANKLTIELKKKQKTTSGKIWGKFSESPTLFLGSVFLAINLLTIVYGLLIGDMLFPVWQWIKDFFNQRGSGYVELIKLLVETVLSSIILVFVVLIFKAIFKARNHQVLHSPALSYFAEFFHWTFSSLASFFGKISEWILKYIFNIKVRTSKEAFNKVDWEFFNQQQMEKQEEDTSVINKELFENALTLSETKLRKCLIPRNEIESIEINQSVEILRARFQETQLSKIIVFEKNIDNIVGYVHHLDFFNQPSTIKDIIHTISSVPETMNVTDLMAKFSNERKSIAWVIDEFGGTAGIVTMEDLLEEIFGEIEDEYDVPETLYDKQITEHEFVFSGRLELDFIKHKYGIKFPEIEHTETLSGYIIENHESIPQKDDHIIIGNFEFDILNVSDTRIEMVKLKVLK